MTQTNKQQLDVTGTCCPWPLVRLAQLILQMHPGECLCITGNDPLLKSSVEDYCKVHGHLITEVTALDNRRMTIHIQLKG